ncbi:MAG: hypothetical protein U0263_29155 [Polyangiaceae bacterium]
MKSYAAILGLSFSLATACSSSDHTLGENRMALGDDERSGTCDGHCGGPSESSCYCDAECTSIGDCCADYSVTCKAPTPCAEAASPAGEAGVCIPRTWDGCMQGVWGATSVFTCGDDVAMGCCFPLPGPSVSCGEAGGQCLPHASATCDGSWLPKNVDACSDPDQGCCVPK